MFNFQCSSMRNTFDIRTHYLHSFALNREDRICLQSSPNSNFLFYCFSRKSSNRFVNLQSLNAEFFLFTYQNINSKLEVHVYLVSRLFYGIFIRWTCFESFLLLLLPKSAKKNVELLLFKVLVKMQSAKFELIGRKHRFA